MLGSILNLVTYLCFWGCFVLSLVKVSYFKDCGFNRRKGLCVGFNIIYQRLVSCKNHVFVMFISSLDKVNFQFLYYTICQFYALTN